MISLSSRALAIEYSACMHPSPTLGRLIIGALGEFAILDSRSTARVEIEGAKPPAFEAIGEPRN